MSTTTQCDGCQRTKAENERFVEVVVGTHRFGVNRFDLCPECIGKVSKKIDSHIKSGNRL